LGAHHTPARGHRARWYRRAPFADVTTPKHPRHAGGDPDMSGDVAALTRTRRSSRRRAWRVTPLDVSGASEYAAEDTFAGVLCGYLFNAEAERTALGLTVGEGEECCIALEPIADVALPFSPQLSVVSMHPQFTGVQLLCGHRFSAVSLLWHWCTAPMTCPMCRAPYAPFVRGCQQQARSCKVENFPARSWRQLRGIVREQQYETMRTQDRESMQLVMESVMDTSMQTVLSGADAFFIALSVQRPDGGTLLRFLSMLRTSSTEEALEENTLRFMVPRASVRRFSAAVSSFMAGDAAGPVASTDAAPATTLVQSTVMLRMPFGHSAESLMVPVAKAANIDLPVTARLSSADVPEAPPSQVAFDNGLEDPAALLAVTYVNATLTSQRAHYAPTQPERAAAGPTTASQQAGTASTAPAAPAPGARMRAHAAHVAHAARAPPVALAAPPAALSTSDSESISRGLSAHFSTDDNNNNNNNNDSNSNNDDNSNRVPGDAAPSPALVSQTDNALLDHPLDAARFTTISARCVDAGGALDMEFYRYAGPGSTTMLSMAFSIDLNHVLNTTAHYMSENMV